MVLVELRNRCVTFRVATVCMNLRGMLVAAEVYVTNQAWAGRLHASHVPEVAGYAHNVWHAPKHLLKLLQALHRREGSVQRVIATSKSKKGPERA